MNTRLQALIRKEFIHTRRDVAIVILVLYTFAETVLCGWSLTMDVKHIPTAVLDRDNSPASRALVARFRAADSFNLAATPLDEAEMDRMLDTGQATLGLVIPPGLGRDLAAGRPVSIQAIADGTQPNAALLSLAYVRQIVRTHSSEIEVARLDRAGLTTDGWWPAVANQVRAWYLPELRYVHFSMVSMIAIAVVLLGMMQAAAGFVREKEAGTLEQLLVTPIRPIELILAKLIPLVVLEVAGLAVGVVLAYLVFGVGPHGRPAGTLILFFALSTLAFLASAGLGIWIATIAHTFQQALLLVFFILFPMIFLSGTIIPIRAMPVWLQWLSIVSPMRHYLTIALNVFLKGVGLQAVWSHVALLAGFAIAIMGLGLARFRRGLS